MRRLKIAGIVALLLCAIAVIAAATFRRPQDPPIQPPITSIEEIEKEPPAGDGSQAAFGIRGTIGYTVRDSRGNVKLAGVIHNTVNNEAKNEVFNRIAATGSTGAFDGIAALSVSVGSDDPANGVLAGSITLNLDGDSGTVGNQNPADGTVTTDFSPDHGKGTITVTFTAQVDSVAVKQIVLTKAAEDDTAVSNGIAIPDGDVFAYVDVPDVTLNANDTVQYTWTVNVD